MTERIITKKQGPAINALKVMGSRPFNCSGLVGSIWSNAARLSELALAEIRSCP